MPPLPAARLALLIGLHCLGLLACRATTEPETSTRVPVVLASQAGDDAIASLTMVLRARGSTVSIDDVRAKLYPDGVTRPNALDIVRTAEAFGLTARGVQIEHAAQFEDLRPMLPCIAHVVASEGKFPREIKSLANEVGEFVVIEAVTPKVLSVIYTHSGRRYIPIERFMEHASGVVLLFNEPR